MTDCRVAPEALGIERLPGGHVRIWRDGKKIMLHRWIVEKVEGRTLAPYPEEVVRHTCDNPPCFLYEHLRCGTIADNNRDRDERGRQVAPKGEAHGRSKLTDADVLAIRAAHAMGVTRKELQRRYGMSKRAIARIVTRSGWTHI